MAKKGQKFNKYLEETKRNVVEAYFKNELTLKEISIAYNIKSIDTILSWVNKYSKMGNNAFLEQRGKATKKTSPLKGRPRKRFISEEEKNHYLSHQEENRKYKLLEKEKNKINSNKL